MVLVTSCNKDDENPCTETTWYQDADGDGLGNPDVPFDSCEQPTGYVAGNTDTDDADPNSSNTVIDVDVANFTAANSETTVTTVPCTFSDGTETNCYHYHVDYAGNNNFINCLHGTYVN